MRFNKRFGKLNERKIVEAKPTPISNALKTANMVRLGQVQLENRNFNTTNN